MIYNCMNHVHFTISVYAKVLLILYDFLAKVSSFFLSLMACRSCCSSKGRCM
ncbi:hypothetical protein RchiOBHm_Chr3g0495171 [Rosa chinensis]|uniref:Uncharacterized protein n=1 Tax=Rosa chinensis TaxID=74649 RepID=A0A2P6RH60_ROSCH|nr:hypothetical protein RchiOBHm_Chr3g0495171 [Rosa chinensis]